MQGCATAAELGSRKGQGYRNGENSAVTPSLPIQTNKYKLTSVFDIICGSGGSICVTLSHAQHYYKCVHQCVHLFYFYYYYHYHCYYYYYYY